jgi:hypothetical protein
VAPVDELGQQVILVGALHVDALAPRGVAQPRPLGLAVLDEALEPVAGDARQEAVPLAAVELVGLLAPAVELAAAQERQGSGDLAELLRSGATWDVS